MSLGFWWAGLSWCCWLAAGLGAAVIRMAGVETGTGEVGTAVVEVTRVGTETVEAGTPGVEVTRAKTDESGTVGAKLAGSWNGEAGTGMTEVTGSGTGGVSEACDPVVSVDKLTYVVCEVELVFVCEY